MKFKPHWIYVLAVSFSLCPRLSAQENSAERLATVIQVSPKVEHFHGTASKVLKVGVPLYGGDRVKSSELGSAAMVLGDGSTVRLSRNSEMTLSPDSKSGSSSVLELIKGLLQANVHKQGSATFQIKTASGVAAVKGTQLQVDAGGAQTEVKVLEGVVELHSAMGEKSVSIASGEKALSYGDRVSEVKKMTAAEVAALRKAFKDRVFRQKADYSNRVKSLIK